MPSSATSAASGATFFLRVVVVLQCSQMLWRIPNAMESKKTLKGTFAVFLPMV